MNSKGQINSLGRTKIRDPFILLSAWKNLNGNDYTWTCKHEMTFKLFKNNLNMTYSCIWTTGCSISLLVCSAVRILNAIDSFSSSSSWQTNKMQFKNLLYNAHECTHVDLYIWTCTYMFLTLLLSSVVGIICICICNIVEPNLFYFLFYVFAFFFVCDDLYLF